MAAQRAPAVSAGGLCRAPFGLPLRSTAKQPRRPDEQHDEEPVQAYKLQRSSQDTTVTFTNTTGAPAAGVKLSISVPRQWNSFVPGTTQTSVTIAGNVPTPGAPNQYYRSGLSHRRPGNRAKSVSVDTSSA